MSENFDWPEWPDGTPPWELPDHPLEDEINDARIGTLRFVGTALQWMVATIETTGRTAERQARTIKRTGRAVWWIFVLVIILGAVVGATRVVVDGLREDVAAAEARADRAEAAARDAVEKTLENRQIGYANQAMYCAQLILQGAEIDQFPACAADPNLMIEDPSQRINLDEIQRQADEELAQSCAVIRDLGVPLPSMCSGTGVLGGAP